MWRKEPSPEMLLEKRRKGWSELLDFTLSWLNFSRNSSSATLFHIIARPTSALQHDRVSPKLRYLFQGSYSRLKLSTEFSPVQRITTSAASQLSPSIAHLFNLQLLLSQHSFTKNRLLLKSHYSSAGISSPWWPGDTGHQKWPGDF